VSAAPGRPGVWLEKRGAVPPHEIVTPEGVPLRFEVGGVGERFGAFVLDLVAIFAAVLLLVLLASLALAGSFGASWLMAFTILAAFLLRSFYFVFFELRWQGMTPGKRRMGLRVIDRAGGPLTGDAIFVRNLLREVEFFLPIVALLDPAVLWPGATGVFYLLVSLWLVIFALMPLFNRQRLRIGDMVAGTIVVRAPRALLLPDLSSRRPAERLLSGAHAVPAEVRFTAAQLEIYGIYELQVLERLLRGDGPSDLESLAAVAAAIQKKIGWPADAPAVAPGTFLREFYAAQRARLEHDMLMGRRRERKRDAPE
jgi:uncharacterized RDD family membrane protein YckC